MHLQQNSIRGTVPAIMTENAATLSLSSALSDSQALSLWLGKPAPRYTSYPPATQFRPVDAGVEGRYISALQNAGAAGEHFSIYVHIPFCRELCLYCGCHSVITKREERETAYLVALHWELALLRQKLGRKLKAAHIHFGGGSPSTLKPEQLKALMDDLRLTFDVLPAAEIAMELDPRTTSPDLITALAAEGFNRVSLGVQDFDAKVQEAIHRIQPYETVERVMTALRAAGITAINLDIMYGLPLQSLASIQKTVEQVLTLNPTRIALFSYAHVPSMKPYQKKLEQYGLPTSEEKLAQEMLARQLLCAAGYTAIGIDHFAKPDDPLSKAQAAGRLHRNFQGYTDDPSDWMIGVGASSISDAGQMFVQNEPDLETYQQQIVAGHLPLKRMCVRPAEDEERGQIIRRLMCDFAVDLASISAHPEAYAKELAALKPFADAGLIALDGYTIKLTTPHLMAIRTICTLFDSYYKPETTSSKVA